MLNAARINRDSDQVVFRFLVQLHGPGHPAGPVLDVAECHGNGRLRGRGGLGELPRAAHDGNVLGEEAVSRLTEDEETNLWRQPRNQRNIPGAGRIVAGHALLKVVRQTGVSALDPWVHDDGGLPQAMNLVWGVALLNKELEAVYMYRGALFAALASAAAVEFAKRGLDLVPLLGKRPRRGRLSIVYL